MESFIPSWLSGRILPITQAVAERWGILEAQRQLAGKPLGVADGMIAATALENDLTIVTPPWASRQFFPPTPPILYGRKKSYTNRTTTIVMSSCWSAPAVNASTRSRI
jgi:hypothetical protein